MSLLQIVTDIPKKQDFDYKKFILSNEQINNELNDFLNGRITKGYTIGLQEFDKYFCCKKNEFYILTGKKGQGKTTIFQALQVMQSLANDLIWVVAFAENSPWTVKLNYLNYYLETFARECQKTDPQKYQKALKWIDKHFIFINVTDIKTATEVTKAIINNGIDVHALVLDPINSFTNGWQNTGNAYNDGVRASLELLEFTKTCCSVHISQHPTMTGQRQEGAVTSYQAEGGWFLNKASFTYVINRERGSNMNELIIENVRNKHTGGEETDPENPIILDWSPTKIGLYFKKEPHKKIDNIIGQLKKHKFDNTHS